jgi:hypothetical protein
MPNIYFDLETGPLPRDEALQVAPAFEPDGRLKDPEKIAADLDAKENKWYDRAALDALTGRVECFAWAAGNAEPKTMDFTKHDEKEIVTFALDGLDKAMLNGNTIVGFNIRKFDLPFLLRRAIILGIVVPKTLKAQAVYPYSELIADLLQIWLFGDRDFTGQSLKNIAVRCGVGEKSGEGADFSTLLKTNYEEAIAYAKNDIVITRALANRMGY